jgi:hypothetical protein
VRSARPVKRPSPADTKSLPLINGSARLELPSGTGWIIYAMNDQAGAGSFNLDAYVICAS